MPEHFKIVSIKESFRLNDAGDSTQTKQILFRVGDDGPFSVEIPTAEFDPDKVRALLEAEADKIVALRAPR